MSFKETFAYAFYIFLVILFIVILAPFIFLVLTIDPFVRDENYYGEIYNLIRFKMYENNS